MHSNSPRIGLLLCAIATGCAAETEVEDTGLRRDAASWNVDGSTPGNDARDAAPNPHDVVAHDVVNAGDATGCSAPDMLIVLDRTMSMHSRPTGGTPSDTPEGHRETKWYIALTAIGQVTAALGSTIRFGLELFPRDPGGDVCVTLAQRIQGTRATNPRCEPGQVIVRPGLDQATAIVQAVDPETTLLCASTPIGAGLVSASEELAAIANPVRDQNVLLISDGSDTCDPALPLATVQRMGARGVRVYVVAFNGDGSIDNEMLNNLACAGRTAIGFPTPCTANGRGDYVATNPSGAALFLRADEGTSLVRALTTIGAEICCGCPG